MEKLKLKRPPLVKHRTLLIVGGLLLLVCCTLIWISKPDQLLQAPTSFVVEDEEGHLMSASIAEDGQWRFPAAESIPKRFEEALLCFEDARYYWHPGIDPLALMRASWQYLKERRVVSGGSTISMQVARLNRGGRERNLKQKCIEMAHALGLELRYSKREILQLYVGNAPFGSNVVGLEAACWRYFGRGPETLTWAEAATLAVLPNAPSLIHPGRNRDRLLQKRNKLLDQLHEKGRIDAETTELAKLEPLPDSPLPLPQLAPHVLQDFRKQFQRSKQSDGRYPSTRLKSTLNRHLQQRAQEILQNHHDINQANDILNAAALIVRVDDAEVLAYVGNISSSDPEAEAYVDMIKALRSPGSTLKPLLYAAMLHDGLLLPHTLVPDVPTQIGGFTPQNFELAYDGAVPASAALSRSLNVPAIKMLQQYKYPRFYDFLKRVGISSLTRPAEHYGLSMILGGAEVSPWELSGTYASLARTLKSNPKENQLMAQQQVYFPPTYMRSGKDLGSFENDRGRSAQLPLNRSAIFYTFQAMNELTRPDSDALWEQFQSARKIAWKTGTSYGFRDAWAIGVTPDYVVCVWVGNADGEGRPTLTGIQKAAPILFELFSLLPRDESTFPVPTEELIQVPVCAESGHLAGPHCDHAEEVFVPANGHKSPVCPYHQLVHTTLSGDYRVTASCANSNAWVTQSRFVLPPIMEYYFKRKNAWYRGLPPYLPGCEPLSNSAMELIYPRNLAKIYIPLELDGKRGKVVFHAVHQDDRASIFWHVNEEYQGETNQKHQLALTLSPGKYTLTLVDDAGNRLTQQFEILEKQ